MSKNEILNISQNQYQLKNLTKNLMIEDTRLIAFNELIKTKKLPKRRKEVAEALLCAIEPMTSSMLEEWCNKQERFKHLRRCTITGRFNELEKVGIIAVFKIAPCEITGSTAKYYTVVEGWL